MATAPVFVVDSLNGARAGGAFGLDGPEGRHAVAVRRLRAGEGIVLTDGAGTGVAGTVAAIEDRDRLSVAVDRVWHEPPPRPWLTVVQALPKGDRGELAVETMTETGVDAIVPWSAARCVTQWRGERGARALGRWRATAREAGKQARRVRFPRVTDAHTTAQLVRALTAPTPPFGAAWPDRGPTVTDAPAFAPHTSPERPAASADATPGRPGTADAASARPGTGDAASSRAETAVASPGPAGKAFVLHEAATEPLATAPLPAEGGITLIVGPEGGVTDEELAAFTEAGARPFRLGPTVLRTSTAGTAAAAVILSRTGRWN
ncbi:RsmE family RNA methyltransferase [Streptomyces sp. B6B3]|uniref:RsmE family RNA methyltransferase n=1 Tax=Streptomyces sp. B6B3 TaxID=3153570 RepID=UPI00325C9EAB